MHFQKVASEVFKRTQEVKRGLDARDFHRPRQVLGGRNTAGLEIPAVTHLVLRRGKGCQKSPCVDSRWKKKRRKSHQRKSRSLRAGQHELTDQNTARLSEEEQEEVIWRFDALPRAASLQGSQASALPRAPVSSRKGNGEMEPGYLSPCAARA